MVSNTPQTALTILIVDDELITRQVLADQLSQRHYTVIQAASGIEALTLISNGLQPDLILLDVMMPQMNGYEVTQKLREKWRADELPIILLTANPHHTGVVKGLEVGANDYLIRPISTHELLARINTYLHIQQLKAEAFKAVRDGEQRLRQFLEVMPVGILIIDAQDQLFYQNQITTHIFGKDQSSKLSATQLPDVYQLYQAGTTEIYPASKLPVQRALRGETARVDDIEVHQGEKIIPLEICGTPIFAGDHIVYAICVLQDISERQLAEVARHQHDKQQLKSLEDKFHDLAANVPGVIYQWYERQTGERGFYYVSPRCEDLYGVKAEDWLQNPKLLPLHPEDLPKWHDSFKQACETKQDFSFEGRFVLPSGQIKWWRSISRPVQVNDQEIVFNGILIDIMEQKNMEVALREKEKILADAQRMASLGSWVWDIKTGTVYRSEQDCRNCGLAPANYTPTYEAFIAPIHPDDQHVIDTLLETCIIEGQTAEVEFRVTWPDGQVRTLRSQAELEFNESGTPIRLKGFNQDVTERKRVEEAFQQKTKELALINRVAGIFSSTIELNEVLEVILEEVQHLLGIAITSLWLATDTNELVCRHAKGDSSDVVIGWRLPIGQGFTGGAAQTGEPVLVSDTRQDERHFKGVDKKTGVELRSILCVPLLTSGKVVGVLNLADPKANCFSPDDLNLLEAIASSAANAIENARLYTLSQQELAERKRAEAQIQQQNIELQAKNAQLEHLTKELAEAQKEKLFQLNKAYERFVPRQFLSLLDKNSVLDVQLGDQVFKEMTILFADIRGFTTLSEQMSPQDVFDFVNNYMGQMEPIILEEGGVIDKYIGDAIMALFPLRADDAVRGAIGMLKTLTKYNDLLQRAGLPQIKIGIGLNTGPLMLGTVGGQNRMDGTVISDAVNVASRVQDLTKIYHTPLLITEQTYLKLVDPSRYHIRVIDAAKVKGKSQPVTIYEVYDADPQDSVTLKDDTLADFETGFVLYHSGEVQDAYPLFENVLQCHEQDWAAQVYLERCRETLDAVPPTGGTILIVDDIVENVAVLFDMLSHQGFEVLVADSGETALHVLLHEKPDVILLDVMMPGMDGFETCRQLKEQSETRDIPIIFITALTSTTDKLKGFETGAVDYITKPFQHEEVLVRVRTQLNLRYFQKQLQTKNRELRRHNLELQEKMKITNREERQKECQEGKA